LSSLAPPSSEWIINVLKIVAGELNMLEILVVIEEGMWKGELQQQPLSKQS